jgi:hypothetical protein
MKVINAAVRSILQMERDLVPLRWQRDGLSAGPLGGFTIHIHLELILYETIYQSVFLLVNHF